MSHIGVRLPSVTTPSSAPRRIRAPSGFEDHLCRREAAALLGFASEFKVRQLEKDGRLHPIRGAMGSAWYARDEVEALRGKGAPTPAATIAGRLRWPDDALIALLREKPRTVVDLVVDAGIPIARAERVYRFWKTHEAPRPAPQPIDGRAAPDPGAAAGEPSERRSGERIEHDALLRQLRDADPKVRAAAFDKLKSRRR
ncbi:MAG TPA: hypothetical protein VKZ18_18300 [Polyangia bacterium]|nr:hypothetical protein [Polyangia bacterium]